MKKSGRLILAMLAVLAAAGGSAQATEWGSIYFSPSSHATGFSHNYDTQGQAERAAYNHCDGDDCRKAISFYNSCGALAIGSAGGWGSSWGNSGNAAQRNALNQCRRNDRGCAIVRWQCSKP